MTDDLLSRATRALREESEEGDAGVRFTRARVMAGLQQTAARRRLRLAFALPLAACFAAATAFGTMKGRTTELWHEVTQALGLVQADKAPAPTKSGKRLAKPVEVTPPAPPVEPAPPAPEVAPPEPTPAPSAAETQTPAAPPASVRAPREAVPRVTAEPTKPTASAQSEPAPLPAPAPEATDPAHELYRVAHQSHFVDHDFASALRAWDAYLAAAPSGRFAPEARYNRALCLVRLGRKDDAERALRPFADGAYGAYRRDEAKALIEALQR